MNSDVAIDHESFSVHNFHAHNTVRTMSNCGSSHRGSLTFAGVFLKAREVVNDCVHPGANFVGARENIFIYFKFVAV